MKNIILTAYAILLSISLIQAQENKEIKGKNPTQKKLHVKLKDGAKPDIYVDGKKFDFPMELLDANKIESVNVLKGEKALKQYDAKHGVVLVTTKKNMVEIKESQIKVNNDNDEGKTPMIIINGKQSDREALKKLSPDDIESIKVVKDEKALKNYNAPNGVIVVITKKE